MKRKAKILKKITVALPMNAVESLSALINQRASWSGAILNRLESFPCTKRGHSGNQLLIKIIQQQA